MMRAGVRGLSVSHLAIVTALFASLAGAQPSSPRSLAQLDAEIAQGVRDWKAPGYAVAIVKDGKLVLAKGYGVRELGKPEPVDADTLFSIGSTTKAMTAAAIGMLVDEGKVAWDDPVRKHLPWFQTADPVVTHELTVRDLLTHRGSMPNTDFLWYGVDRGAREVIAAMRLVKPETSLRSHFTYQNVMYAAAGAVVESASAMSWHEFMKARVLTPLGMTRTHTSLSSVRQTTNVASPHFEIEGQVRVIENASVDSVAPAGSIWSSVNDMSKWITFLLAGGKTVDGRALLKPETHAELFKPQTIVDRSAFYPTQALTKPNWTTYGLGWFQHDYAGEQLDYHTGSIDGLVAMAALIRARGVGVYALGNLDHAELRHAIVYRVMDHYLGRPARDWRGEFRKLYADLAAQGKAAQAKAQGEPVSGTKPSLKLSEYAGRYADPLHGAVDVTFDATKGNLSYRFGPFLTGRMEHWNFDTFRFVSDRAWQGSTNGTFVLDAQGRAATLSVDGVTYSREAAKE